MDTRNQQSTEESFESWAVRHLAENDDLLNELVQRLQRVERRLDAAGVRPAPAWRITAWLDRNGERWLRVGDSELARREDDDKGPSAFRVTVAELQRQLGPLRPDRVDDLPALLAELDRAWLGGGGQ